MSRLTSALRFGCRYRAHWDIWSRKSVHIPSLAATIDRLDLREGL